jgi:hypothetical protein
MAHGNAPGLATAEVAEDGLLLILVQKNTTGRTCGSTLPTACTGIGHNFDKTADPVPVDCISRAGIPTGRPIALLANHRYRLCQTLAFIPGYADGGSFGMAFTKMMQGTDHFAFPATRTPLRINADIVNHRSPPVFCQIMKMDMI